MQIVSLANEGIEFLNQDLMHEIASLNELSGADKAEKLQELAHSIEPLIIQTLKIWV
ncbi:MAG: hypothetical protein HWD61_04950 [Parachlamydiaceae bacterium]|nr:MAG: hypothetical protein HWD61_04950 [Parachlamydiaceae bacterium]